MPQHVTEESMKELAESFKMYDKNGDGNITSDELISVLRCLNQNPTNAEVADMIKEMDSNGNGKINFREFTDYMRKRGIKTQQEEAEEIREAFKILDKDRNGYISAHELRHTMKCFGERMTEEEADDFINLADRNGDGTINYQEFVDILTKKH